MNTITPQAKGVFFKVAGAVVTISLFALMTPSYAAAQVSPLVVNEDVNYGESINVEKEVTTPTIPQDPEICFLADTTGSMGAALANITANANAIMNDVLAVQPNAEFCATQYRDEGDTLLFSVDQDLTTNTGDVQTAIASWVASGGGDEPEAQLNALNELATGATSFDGPNRIVVWFGDAPGHDPSAGVDQASAISALQAAGITVIAVPVDTFASGLDATGQATAITDATDGVLLPDADPSEVSDAIVTGITSLTSDVWFEVNTCTSGLNVSLSPDVHYDVVGGDTVSFDETITVDNDSSLEGQSLSCSVSFYSNSYPDGGDLIGTQRILITVPDTTGPAVQCVSTTNPHGKNTPPAGSSDLPGSKGGQNEDGFYQLIAEDESGIESIYVSGFGSYLSGDKIKVTEKKQGAEKEKKMGSTQGGNNGQSDAIVAHLLLNDDPVVVATDGAGNTSEVTCYVPPLPK